MPEASRPHPDLSRARRALAGHEPFIPGARVRPSAVPSSVAAVLATSGSTGAAKLVALSAGALTASARATLSRLGGPGHWLGTLPLTHVAGLQVLVRAEISAMSVTPMPAGPFEPAGFTRAVAAMPAGRRYVSLVPAQLHRILTGPAAAIDALASFSAVLVGGQALDTALGERAAAAGIAVVRTYGSSETSGGCVYEGSPLAGVSVEVTASGRIWVRGPVLAEGYLDPAGRLAPMTGQLPGRGTGAEIAGFTMAGGERAFVTCDIGAWGTDGRLRVSGRADDVIITGGENVHPGPVESALRALPGVADAVVVGVPDPEWGQRLVALIEAGGDAPPPGLAAVRCVIGGQLGRAAAPRQLICVPALPRGALGKPDRAACLGLAQG